MITGANDQNINILIVVFFLGDVACIPWRKAQVTQFHGSLTQEIVQHALFSHRVVALLRQAPGISKFVGAAAVPYVAATAAELHAPHQTLPPLKP